MTPDLPRTLLVVSHDAQLGGAQLSLVDTVTALVARGVAVHVLVPRRERWEQKLLPRLVAAGATVHGGRVTQWGMRSRGESAWSSVRSFISRPVAKRATAALAKAVGAEAVLSNTSLVVSGESAARMAGLPHLWLLHERQWRPDQPVRLRALARRRRRMAGSSDVVVPSRFLAQECVEWCAPGRLHVVTPAVTLVSASRQDGGAPEHLLCPGGLQPVKRPQEALEAFALLAPDWPGLTLEFVGYGGHDGSADKHRFERWAQVRGLADRLQIRGFDPAGPWAASRRGTVLVSTGVDETFGRVLVEAMGQGIPVVSAAGGAAPEVIRDGETGLLYEAGDPAALAAALQLLRRDAALRSTLIATGRSEAETRWSHAAHAAALLEVVRVSLARESSRQQSPQR